MGKNEPKAIIDRSLLTESLLRPEPDFGRIYFLRSTDHGSRVLARRNGVVENVRIKWPLALVDAHTQALTWSARLTHCLFSTDKFSLGRSFALHTQSMETLCIYLSQAFCPQRFTLLPICGLALRTLCVRVCA